MEMDQVGHLLSSALQWEAWRDGAAVGGDQLGGGLVVETSEQQDFSSVQIPTEVELPLCSEWNLREGPLHSPLCLTLWTGMYPLPPTRPLRDHLSLRPPLHPVQHGPSYERGELSGPCLSVGEGPRERVEHQAGPDSVQFTAYRVQFTVYRLQCTVYSLQFTVYSLQFTVYSVQCTAPVSLVDVAATEEAPAHCVLIPADKIFHEFSIFYKIFFKNSNILQ